MKFMEIQETTDMASGWSVEDHKTACLEFFKKRYGRPFDCYAVYIEGLDSVEAFASMNGDSDIMEMAKRRMASRPNTSAGRFILGTMQIKRLQAFIYWFKDHNKRGLQTVPEMWTQEVM
jgi:hypothetical protein